MRTLVILSTVLILATAVNAAADGPKLETEEQKTLYALGLTINRSLSPFNLSPSELELVEAGLADGSLHKTPTVDLQTYGPKIRQFQEARAAAVAAMEKKTSQVFVDQAAREPGATKTASGLIMIPITPGTGASPKATDTVTVKYEGRLTDGTVFDRSVQRGEPATVPLNGVIKCWAEALQFVKVGGKSRLVCPADLAYGDQGWPPLIKPGATLVYEVELLRIARPSARTPVQSERASSWYYCNDAKTYYPYTGMSLGLGAGRPADGATWAIDETERGKAYRLPCVLQRARISSGGITARLERGFRSMLARSCVIHHGRGIRQLDDRLTIERPDTEYRGASRT